MKRALIEVGKEYAIRCGSRAQRGMVLAINPQSVRMTVQWNGRTFERGAVSLSAILMPWEAWEAEQKAKQEERAAIDARRMAAHESLGERLHKHLVDRAVVYEAWDPERGTVTLRWEDLARLVGGKAP